MGVCYKARDDGKDAPPCRRAPLSTKTAAVAARKPAVCCAPWT